MKSQANHNDLDTKTVSIPLRQLYLILIVLLILFGLAAWPRINQDLGLFTTPTTTSTSTSIPSPTTAPTDTPTQTSQPTPTSLPSPTTTPYAYRFAPDLGTLILSLQEGLDSHLFAFQPTLSQEGDTFTGLPLLRLTSGSHQDIDPAISSNGKRIAFSSNRNGVWDIYILDLENGELTQFTDTDQYEGSPTWSPDDNWLAFEAYQKGNLEIIIRDVAKESAPINLTNNPAADYAPSWSAEGRRISFVSTRSGVSQIWIADLDQPTDDKTRSIVNIPAQRVQHPSWSPDGRFLTWGVITPDGLHQLYTWDSENPDREPRLAGTGDRPVWGGHGELLFSILERPDDHYLTGYPTGSDQPRVMLPGIELPGKVQGFTWGENLPLNKVIDNAAAITPTPLYHKPTQAASGLPGNRIDLASLEDVEAPHPELNERVIQAFNQLRSATAQRAGWDFLATLENAYIPLTTPIDPTLEQDWLYTGRAFAVSTLPLEANWMVVVREDFGSETYWRIYIRALAQQGSQGKPLQHHPWDFAARSDGAPMHFERGGALSSSIPSGYWIDFTALADAYDWDRFPSLPFWRTAYPSTRFNKFALTEGMNWRSAMLEIYPEEALYTPTPNP